jgi:hypothetical protein
VAGATVTVIQIDTGIKRDLQTTSAGSYAATFLKPGHYELIFAATGFAKVDRKDLVVQVGQVVTIDAQLPVATAQDTVTITGETPLIDTQKIGASQEIGADVLSNVPINGRRFDNVVLLTPNVVPDGASGLLSFRGISGLYNTNLIDGANNNQAFFSEAGRSALPTYTRRIPFRSFNRARLPTALLLARLPVDRSTRLRDRAATNSMVMWVCTLEIQN